ncbi:MAG: hypothetical protein WDO12_04165 [Pseudomonadota bacterium]
MRAAQASAAEALYCEYSQMISPKRPVRPVPPAIGFTSAVEMSVRMPARAQQCRGTFDAFHRCHADAIQRAVRGTQHLAGELCILRDDARQRARSEASSSFTASSSCGQQRRTRRCVARLGADLRHMLAGSQQQLRLRGIGRGIGIGGAANRSTPSHRRDGARAPAEWLVVPARAW